MKRRSAGVWVGIAVLFAGLLAWAGVRTINGVEFPGSAVLWADSIVFDISNKDTKLARTAANTLTVDGNGTSVTMIVSGTISGPSAGDLTIKSQGLNDIYFNGDTGGIFYFYPAGARTCTFKASTIRVDDNIELDVGSSEDAGMLWRTTGMTTDQCRIFSKSPFLFHFMTGTNNTDDFGMTAASNPTIVMRSASAAATATDEYATVAHTISALYVGLGHQVAVFRDLTDSTDILKIEDGTLTGRSDGTTTLQSGSGYELLLSCPGYGSLSLATTGSVFSGSLTFDTGDLALSAGSLTLGSETTIAALSTATKIASATPAWVFHDSTGTGAECLTIVGTAGGGAVTINAPEGHLYLDAVSGSRVYIHSNATLATYFDSDGDHHIDNKASAWGSSNDFRASWQTAPTVDQARLGVDATGRILTLCDVVDIAEDYGLAAQSNPTLVIRSASAAATSTVEYASIARSTSSTLITDGEVAWTFQGPLAEALTITGTAGGGTVTLTAPEGSINLNPLGVNRLQIGATSTWTSTQIINDDYTVNFGTGADVRVQGELHSGLVDNTATTLLTCNTGTGDYAFVTIKYGVHFAVGGEVCSEAGIVTMMIVNDATSGRGASTPTKSGTSQFLTAGEALTVTWTVDTSADGVLIQVTADATMDGGAPGTGTLRWEATYSGDVTMTVAGS